MKTIPAKENVPSHHLVHSSSTRLLKCTTKKSIEEPSIKKYRSSGYGITFEDVISRFCVRLQTVKLMHQDVSSNSIVISTRFTGQVIAIQNLLAQMGLLDNYDISH